jgi:hypothetical protein
MKETPTINIGRGIVKVEPSYIEERFGITLNNKQTQEVLDELRSLTLCSDDNPFIQDRIMDWLEDYEYLIDEVLNKEDE